MNLLEGLWNHEVPGPNHTVSDSTDLEWCLGIRLSTSSWEMLPLLVRRPLAGNHGPAPRDTAGIIEPASVICKKQIRKKGQDAGAVTFGSGRQERHPGGQCSTQQ